MDTRNTLIDDEQLIGEALAGKTESFALLVRKYQDRLYTTLTHITGSTHDAEELSQDALLQAFRKLSTFQGKSSFYTWLYRIAFNLTMSRNRRQRPPTTSGWGNGGDRVSATLALDPVDSGESPTETLERQERAMQVQAALQRMAEEARQMIILRELENCDYETIASMLDIPVGTVRSRLHRARLQLREQLQHVFENP